MKNLSWNLGGMVVIAVLLCANATGVAQERQRPEPPKQTERQPGARVRPQEPEPPSDEPKREREGGIPKEDIQQRDAQVQEGTEEGMPEMRSAPNQRTIEPRIRPPERRYWRLGVFAHNTDTGVVVTRVLPQSAAAKVGLEPGDRIVSIDGFQVGWVRDRLYPLGEELQRQAGRRGHVLLLVQNVRDQGLLTIDVQLDRMR